MDKPIDRHPFTKFPKRPRLWPRLLVRVHGSSDEKSVVAWALVDTGADCCALPLSWKERLGIAFTEKDKVDNVFSAGIHHDICYKKEAAISVLHSIERSSNSKCFVPGSVAINLPKYEVLFLENLGYPILGMKGFLDEYVLALNYQCKQFSIFHPEPKRPCEICQAPKEKPETQPINQQST